ncbi:maestro heat-like repeat-containing protein family member 1 [Amia ocellicauda]|uniref:maestro heat-like repeat-containing protein family member 1 n=1 Tax=Amia ocellicauda TaxID=2972642 RepID=UPI003464201E
MTGECPTRQGGAATATHSVADQASDAQDDLLLSDLRDCLQKTLPFFRSLSQNPKVPLRYRRVIREAVETVARGEVLSCPLRVTASIVALGITQTTGRELRRLPVHCANQTYFYKRVILCYGFVTMQIPAAKLQAFLKHDILPKMSHFFTSRDLTVRAAVCFSLSVMARAVGKTGVEFPHKEQVLNVMMNYIRVCPTADCSPSYCQKVLHASIYLSQVRPFLRRKQTRLVQLFVRAVLSIPIEGVSDTYFEDVFAGNSCGLLALLTKTLSQDITARTLVQLLEPLQSMCSYPHNVTRVTALTLLNTLLRIYWVETEITRGLGIALAIPPVDSLLASLLPRLWEPEPEVFEQAVMGIKTLLDMWLHSEGCDFDQEQVDFIQEWFYEESSDLHSCDAVIQIVNGLFTLQQKQTLVQGLLIGLQDPQPSSALGCCTLLCQLLRSHPDELYGLVPQVLHAFLDLSSAEERVRQRAKEGVLQLLFQDRALAIKSLINYLPPAENTIQYQQWHRELWGAIGASSLGPFTFRVLVFQLSTTSHAWVACTVLGVLTELSLEAVTFAELFAALLPLLGAENRNPDTGFTVQRFVADSLRLLLSRAQLDEVALQLQHDWGLIQEPGRVPEGIFRLTRALKTFVAPVLLEVVRLLWQRYGSADRGQRICIAAFFSVLLQPPQLTDHQLWTTVMNRTLQLCEDPLEDVRLLARQGLKAVPTKEMHRYAKEQLKLLSGSLSQWVIEGKPVILRAVSSLGPILRLCEDGTAERIILKLYHTAKECLENPDSEIRGATVLLLGELVTAASVKKALQKQCHGSLAMLLLHLQDPRPAVSQVCQRILRQCAPALGCPTLTELIQGHLSQETFDFTSLVRDVAAVLRARLPSAMAVYRRCALRLSKSSVPQLRTGAAVFIGALLENIDMTICGFCASMKLKKALSALLKDSDPRVQRKAAEVKAGFPQR